MKTFTNYKIQDTFRKLKSLNFKSLNLILLLRGLLKIRVQCIFILLFCSSALFAQNKHYFAGKMYIDTAGFVYIAKHDTVKLHGNVTSVRQPAVDKRGMLSFADSTNWKSDNESFVNGYVRSHKTGAFIFPVGQGAYRPAAISKSADATPTDVAYHNTAQYDKNALDADINGITDESWLIFGTTAAIITLSWSADISSLVDDITHIGIAGWDGTKWVKIASEVDNVSPIFGTTSDISTTGSISTLSEIEPNSYFAYTLAIVKCPKLECDIVLDLKLFLEGVTNEGPVMSTYLQGISRYPDLVPDKALPLQNPFPNMPEKYSQINEDSGPAGKVVDWILVEILTNFEHFEYEDIQYTLYDLVAKRALLLKPDGSVVDSTGKKPTFKPFEFDSIRIVVKARNHLAIISSALFAFDSDVTYNFSDDVSKALKLSWASYPAMTYKNGVACLYAGDIWNGTPADCTTNVINATDIDRYNSRLINGWSLGCYCFEDVNMDGMVDGGDLTFISASGKQVTQSSLLYYVKRP